MEKAAELPIAVDVLPYRGETVPSIALSLSFYRSIDCFV